MKRIQFLAAIVTLTFTATGGAEAPSAGAGAVQPPASCASADVPASIIAFDGPARDLTAEGFPIGNGRMGLLIQGGIDRESDAICEDSVWAGWQNPKADNEKAAGSVPEIRRLFAEGKISEAQNLINKTQVSRVDDGEGHSTYEAYGTYEMLARLEIETGQTGADADDYLRWLDMTTGTVHVAYTLNNVNYTRTYFASRPDEVQVIEFSASEPGRISFSATIERPDTGSTVTADGKDALLLTGAHNAPLEKDGKGLAYACRLGAKAVGGTLEVKDGRIVATGCDRVTLYLTARTNYKGIRAWPNYLDKTNAHIEKSLAELDAARSANTDTLYERHAADFGRLFGAMAFRLTDEEPRERRFHSAPAVENAEKGVVTPQLVETYFSYGRYLLISSSREGDLPANLQGIWAANYLDEKSGNWGYHLPWEGDYHANVNIQMNYWAAYSANLADCAGPLYDLISALPGPGTITAKTQHGCEGWTTHTMNNVWGYTAPGWEASWGHFPMAGPWMATHIWTGYAYTLDKVFLARMWPTLRGSAQFVLSWMTFDKDGRLVSGPSESPENRFTLPDGTTGYFCMGPSMDQELCAQLLDETLRAAKVLGIEDELTKKCAEALPKIRPVGIGPDGRLLEWTEPYDEPEPGHRHTSHLFGLYPGTTISLEKTPELAAAARKSLEYRTAHGGGYTGWSRAMMMGEWARLGDGEKAYENLAALLKSSTLPNLFDLCPPFQIDGNFGATAGIVEMLLQSRLESDNTTTIDLLPALPSEWASGFANGIVAQGAVTVDIEWKNGLLSSVRLLPKETIRCHVRHAGKRVDVELVKGVETILDGNLGKVR